MNNKKLNTIIFIALCASNLYAQDTYDAERFSSKDLNGTARYVGMGGALGALGGDVSVMGSNPAGTALFRRSEAAFSVSALFTEEGALGHDRTRMSIDNLGIVVSNKQHNSSSGLQYVNFGFNYSKRSNFLGNHNLAISNLNGVFSQTWQIADLANMAYDNDSWGMLANMSAPLYDDKTGELTSEGIIMDVYDENGAFLGYEGIGAESANYRRATYGSAMQSDINLSLNFSDRYFLGITMGIYNLDYNRESYYEEIGVDGNYYDFSNWYSTKGDGFDIKLGFICRPFEDSPFRFGLSIHTPIWYKMDDSNGSVLYYNNQLTAEDISEPFYYSLRTPWNFAVSLGHTIGTQFAIGAEYEYTDVSSAKYYAENWDEDIYFRHINSFTSTMLQAQHTIKLGMEFKPVSEFSVRLGYNYVSSPFKNDAYRIIAYDSPFTETDYTNWKDINRLTVGLGYRFKGGYIDMAYQFSSQKGDFYAFDDIDLLPTEIKRDRSQLLCTLGLRF